MLKSPALLAFGLIALPLVILGCANEATPVPPLPAADYTATASPSEAGSHAVPPRSSSDAPAVATTAAAPTTWPVSLPANLTLDVDPSLTNEEMSYLRQALSDALRQASVAFGIPPPKLTVIAYREQAAVVAKRAAWQGETAAQSSNRFECDYCAEASDGVVFLRLGPGWFDEKDFPERLIGRTVAAHEVYHVFQKAALAGNHFGPQWLGEGSAQWFAFRLVSERLGVQWQDVLAAEAFNAATVKVTLEQLEDPRAFTTAEGGVYSLGLYAADSASGSRGAEAFAAFYRAVGRGQDWRAAFATAFGIEVREFYSAFDRVRAGFPPHILSITGVLRGVSGPRDTTLKLDVCSFEDAVRCWPLVVDGDSFTVSVPPGRYVLMVRRNQAVVGYHAAEGLTRDRPRAAVIELNKTDVTDVILTTP